MLLQVAAVNPYQTQRKAYTYADHIDVSPQPHCGIEEPLARNLVCQIRCCQAHPHPQLSVFVPHNEALYATGSFMTDKWKHSLAARVTQPQTSSRSVAA